MSLIVMVVFDTVENDRTKYTKAALDSLFATVDRNKHRIIIVDNASCQATKQLFQDYKDADIDVNSKFPTTVISLSDNIGTAEGWNTACALRQPGEHVIKIDNDIVINNCNDWVEQMENVIRLRPDIGQVGLKRKDCSEWVGHPNAFYRSSLIQLPHTPGERWVVVEKQFHVMGSCVMHSSALLDKIGFMYQIGLYGFDDSFMSARTIKAGFLPVMLPHIDIDHIDDGANPYTAHKQKLANDVWAAGQYRDTLGFIAEGKFYYDRVNKELTCPK